MNDKDRPDLPVVLRAATVIGLLAAVLGTTLLAWMADATFNPDADADAAGRALKAAVDPKTPREVITALREAVGGQP